MNKLLDWNENLGRMPLAVLFVIAFMVVAYSSVARAEPGSEMMLGEFDTRPGVLVETGCVSHNPKQPSYVTFSTIYYGTQDAALQLEHVVNGQWVTSSFEDGLRITVDGDGHDPSQPFVALRGGAHQRFDMTVLGVQPNETWRVVGGHSYGPVKMFASWSAAEQNQCVTPTRL